MLDRFKHILIPLDFSDKNDVALEAVHEFASSNPASVSNISLLHVIEPIGDLVDAETRKFTEQLRKHSENELLKRAQRFSDLDIMVSCENRSGNRVSETLTFVEESAVNLIVLNSHQIRTGEANPTSLSYQIAILAGCPVLLLK